MTEKDYILATDLRSVRLVKILLHDLIPENNEAIPEDEYHAVCCLVRHWEARMEKKLLSEDEE